MFYFKLDIVLITLLILNNLFLWYCDSLKCTFKKKENTFIFVTVALHLMSWYCPTNSKFSARLGCSRNQRTLSKFLWNLQVSHSFIQGMSIFIYLWLLDAKSATETKTLEARREVGFIVLFMHDSSVVCTRQRTIQALCGKATGQLQSATVTGWRSASWGTCSKLIFKHRASSSSDLACAFKWEWQVHFGSLFGL